MILLILLKTLGLILYCFLMFVFMILAMMSIKRKTTRIIHYKYVFKKPNGQLTDTTFTIWSDDESIYNAHSMAKNYLDTYKYYKVAVVDSTLSAEEIMQDIDIEWKTRSEMFYHGKK